MTPQEMVREISLLNISVTKAEKDYAYWLRLSKYGSYVHVVSILALIATIMYVPYGISQWVIFGAIILTFTANITINVKLRKSLKQTKNVRGRIEVLKEQAFKMSTGNFA